VRIERTPGGSLIAMDALLGCVVTQLSG